MKTSESPAVPNDSERDGSPASYTGLAWPHALFPYQQAGIDRLVGANALLLADEMGLGKTIQVIAAIRILKSRGAIQSALVVAPVALVSQWRRHLRLWAPELRLSTAVGTASERALAWRAQADVYLVGYESLRSDIWLKATGAPGTRSWDVVVLDEAQRIKTAGTELALSVKRLNYGRGWALTGTPLENRLDDLISILDFVAPGRLEKNAMVVGLRRLLAEVQLRRRRREVLQDLPPKLHSTVRVELGTKQRATSRRARDEGLIRLRDKGRDLRISHVLELILRLKQICNFCPETAESAKLADLRERLGTVIAAGEKALVFSQFVAEPFGIKQLQRELKQYSPLTLSGDVDEETRNVRLADFERDPTRPLLLLSLKAGGVGLNLVSASYVFHFDRWWNPAVEFQAEDRAHRIGQTRPVHVYAYVCGDTIEERIEEILMEKRALFDRIVDGFDSRVLRQLDLDTLLAIVREA
jgi:SNF2 family DNA or RNA helicase